MHHLLIFNIGGSEMLLILFVVLLFFGSKGVPEIAKSLGKATREFKDAMSGIEREIRDAASTEPAKPKVEEIKKPEGTVEKTSGDPNPVTETK